MVCVRAAVEWGCLCIYAECGGVRGRPYSFMHGCNAGRWVFRGLFRLAVWLSPGNPYGRVGFSRSPLRAESPAIYFVLGRVGKGQRFDRPRFGICSRIHIKMAPGTWENDLHANERNLRARNKNFTESKIQTYMVVPDEKNSQTFQRLPSSLLCVVLPRSQLLSLQASSRRTANEKPELAQHSNSALQLPRDPYKS